METFQGQVWRSSNFTIRRTAGQADGTVVFRFSGRFTARDMYTSLTPAAMRSLFEPPAQEQKVAQIFDLTEVPYMDSAALGVVVSHFAWCQERGVRLVLTGMSKRVLQLFRMTKVGNLIPMVATVEEVDCGQCAVLSTR